MGKFQIPFFWGVSSSAFQVEGFPQDSDWRRWSHTKGRILDGSNANRAAEFWDRYSEDFDWAEKLGVNAFRLSIAWDRIQPEVDRWDEQALEHYSKIIDDLGARGIEPFVTLHHFVLPGWVSDRGGLTATDFPKWFATYAIKVVEKLSPSVRYWMTFNEPEVLAVAGYMLGEWPPGQKKSLLHFERALRNLSRAHLRFVSQLKSDIREKISIGVVIHCRDFQSIDRSPWNRIAEKAIDWIWNRRFLNAIVKRSNRKVKALDFIGVNYYGRSLVSVSSVFPFVSVKMGDGPRSDIDWEIYPSGMEKVLVAAGKYGIPLIVTENGLADSKDRARSRFIEEHLWSVWRACAHGTPVYGYFHWSLTDNFEWAFGLTPRFGLIEIDFQTQERKPRNSFFDYRDLIQVFRENGMGVTRAVPNLVTPKVPSKNEL